MPHRFDHYQPTSSEFLPLGDVDPIGGFVWLQTRLALALICQRHRLTMVRDALVNRRAGQGFEPAGPLPMILVPERAAYPRSTVKGDVHSTVTLPP